MKPSRYLNIALLLLTGNALYAQHINTKLAAELAIIGKADQQYRSAAIAAAKKHGAYSTEDNELMAKQSAVDIANMVKIDAIIAQYGYPGKSLVGAGQSKVAFMVIQHNEIDSQEKHLAIIIEAADKGELEPSLVPLMVDRVRTAKGMAQVYGTQLHESKNGAVQIFPIDDEEFVNVRRKKAGLPPLQDYLKNWNINYKVPTTIGNPNPKSLYYIVAQQEPDAVEAVGGEASIYTKLIYPAAAKTNGVTGYVTVQFVVDGTGDTKNMSVVKGLGYGCDEEAIRVIKDAKFTNKAGEDTEIRMRLPFPYKKK
jgi:TonB family protein